MSEKLTPLLAQYRKIKEQHKDKQFQADEARKDLQATAQIERTGAITRHDLMANRLKTLAEIGTDAQAPKE